MNDWDGVIAVEENPTTDNRRIVAGALEFENELPVMTAASLSNDGPADRLKGRTQAVWREGKLIYAEGLVDAAPGSYSASIAVTGKSKKPLRVHHDDERGTLTITAAIIREIVLMPVDRAVWPEASITVYDGRNPNSHDSQVRRLLELMDQWMESGVLKKHYRDDPTVLQCEHGERLHVGWLEIGHEAMRAQALMDHHGIPDGDPQGKGDLDWRVAEALLELSEARERLDKIKSAHAREETGGMVGDYCVECLWKWPCPTYRQASRERRTDLPWRDE